MKHTLLILGGARSGKSRYAQMRAEHRAGTLAYIATAQAFDAEMVDRISHHQNDRSDRWTTWEEPLDVAGAILRASQTCDVILLDCLTLWLTNLMLGEHDLPRAIQSLHNAIRQCPCPLLIVSNEVGLSIVPENALARRFRDEAGRLNQIIAAEADEVQFIAAGLPLKLK